MIHDDWRWKGNYWDIWVSPAGVVIVAIKIYVINAGQTWIEIIWFEHSCTGLWWPQRTYKMLWTCWWAIWWLSCEWRQVSNMVAVCVSGGQVSNMVTVWWVEAGQQGLDNSALTLWKYIACGVANCLYSVWGYLAQIESAHS